MVREIMTRFKIHNPAPKCELFYKTPYQLLIAVVLSAQATDKSVNKVTTPLFEAGLTPTQVLELGETGFYQLIRSIGLAPTKAKNVLKLTRILCDQHGSQVPRDRKALESLPGVGRKTASVVLGELWQEPTLAVDTHVFRVTARLGLHAEKTADRCEAVLLEKIAAPYLPTAHHWFILHGRYLCTARAPRCDHCFLADLCSKVGVTRPQKRPTKPKTPKRIVPVRP